MNANSISNYLDMSDWSGDDTDNDDNFGLEVRKLIYYYFVKFIILL